ncbi:FUSC family protein [Tsukamurella serpentis]
MSRSGALSIPPSLRPDLADGSHALRVALALVVPGVLLIAWGRAELLVYAEFGAFAGMYGRSRHGRSRITEQVQAAGLLIAGVSLGVTLAVNHAPPWVLVAVGIALATVGSVLADAVRLRPAGPFFFVFAMGATATLPADLAPPALALAVCAVTAVFAVVVGTVGRPDPLHGRPWWTGLALVLRRPAPAVGLHAVRYALAVGTAGALGVGLGVDHANWAMSAAAVPLAVIDTARTSRIVPSTVLTRAAHRTVGTLLGMALTAALLAIDPGPAALALIAIVLLFPTELFMARHYAVAIGFFTPLILLLTELAAPSDPLQMLIFRGVDTVLGVTVGLAVALSIGGPRG